MLDVWTVAVAAFSRAIAGGVRGARAGRAGHRRRRLPAVHLLHVESVRRACCPCRRTAATSTRCCRIRAWSSIRRCCTWATSASRWRSRSRSPRCSAARSTALGALGAAVDDRGLGIPHLGIALGSWWAYYELGWGGWWFWDPVENASLHAVAGRHGADPFAGGDGEARRFRAWTVLLAIVAFSLSLLGTFLVRSGVLTAVHAFAADPRRGMFILVFLAIVIGGSLLLYAWRAPKVAGGERRSRWSRAKRAADRTTCCSSWPRRWCCSARCIPLLVDALNLGKISVGPPYFGFVFLLLMLPVVLLLPFGPFLRWRESETSRAQERAAAGGHCRDRLRDRGRVLRARARRRRSPAWRRRCGCGVGILLYALQALARDAARPALHARDARHDPRAFRRRRVPRRRAAVRGASVEKDVRIAPGETRRDGRLHVPLRRREAHRGSELHADQGTVTVMQERQDDRDAAPAEAHLSARRRCRPNRRSIRACPAISTSRSASRWTGKPTAPGRVRIYVKPFVRWIWARRLFMMLGGFVAGADKRFRARRPGARRCGRVGPPGGQAIAAHERASAAADRLPGAGARLFGFGIWWNTEHDPREVPSPLIGKPAPEFALPLLDDPRKTVSKASTAGQALPAQRVRQLVHRLRRGAPGADGRRPQSRRSVGRLQLQGCARGCQGLARRSTAIRMTW